MTILAHRDGSCTFIPAATLFRLDGILISNLVGHPLPLAFVQGETQEFRLDIPALNLGDGEYVFSLSIFDGSSAVNRASTLSIALTSSRSLVMTHLSPVRSFNCRALGRQLSAPSSLPSRAAACHHRENIPFEMIGPMTHPCSRLGSDSPFQRHFEQDCASRTFSPHRDAFMRELRNTKLNPLSPVHGAEDARNANAKLKSSRFRGALHLLSTESQHSVDDSFQRCLDLQTKSRGKPLPEECARSDKEPGHFGSERQPSLESQRRMGKVSDIKALWVDRSRNTERVGTIMMSFSPPRWQPIGEEVMR